MTSPRTMHLGLFINPTGHHQASWRHPDADADAGVNFEHYRRVALLAEQHCFDMVFLADNQVVREADPESRRRVAQYIANFDRSPCCRRWPRSRTGSVSPAPRR